MMKDKKREALNDILDELERAERKHPEWPVDIYRRKAIIDEEMGELSQAILKNDQAEFEDAIGDCVVVLTNLAELGNVKIEECINSSYDVIAKRKGKMQNGTFVKDSK